MQSVHLNLLSVAGLGDFIIVRLLSYLIIIIIIILLSFFATWKCPWSDLRNYWTEFNNSAVKIQHCPISSKFDMWVDYDVPNWFLTLKNFYRSPFSKWSPQYRTNSTLSDFNDISYVGRLWCPELIPDIEEFLPVSIFKMVTTIPQ